MRVFVTGASGQLGSDVIRMLDLNGIDHCGVSSKQLDVTDQNAVMQAIEGYVPDAVIHCAAYTKVDKAEEEPDKCFAVNAHGTENVAIACQKIAAKMLYISTDYVFDGNGTDYYEVDHPLAPVNVYGISKMNGEIAVMRHLEKYYILRTSWAFGLNGSNFISTILNCAEVGKTLSVVDDQIGSPTYTLDLAALICQMIVTDRYGIYHVTNEGVCSWADLAEKALELNGSKAKVLRIPSEQYKTKAKRPMNSRLSKRSLDENGFIRLSDWDDALLRYFDELKRMEKMT